jgi:hypothetical protein
MNACSSLTAVCKTIARFQKNTLRFFCSQPGLGVIGMVSYL